MLSVGTSYDGLIESWENMKIEIEAMSQENIKEIYDFELENRQYFERTLPPRPAKYFNYESFKNLMNEILLEQLNGECYMCIVRDKSGKMVGRVNLSSIRGHNSKRAELGYRISENEQGKGYASEAIRLILGEGAEKLDLKIIEAGTSTTNIGSQKVLFKNGFEQVGREKKVMMINGDWVDGLLFERCVANG